MTRLQLSSGVSQTNVFLGMPPSRVCLAALAVSVIAAGCLPIEMSRPTTPRDVTTGSLRTLRAAVVRFRDSTGHLPGSLSVLCPAADDDQCWRSHSVRLRDGWGRLFTYETRGADYRLASGGKDGRAGTGDDQMYDSVDEQSLVRRVTGCYKVTAPIRDVPWLTHLALSDAGSPEGSYALSPAPDRYAWATWEVGGVDTVRLTWMEHHGSLQAAVRATQDALVGDLRQHWMSLFRGKTVKRLGILRAARIDCRDLTGAG
jgi:hypothetical protein